MTITIALLGLLATIAAGAGGVGSWAATARLTAIERGRRHSELTPEFEISCATDVNGAPDHGELVLTLVGPTGLDHLDEVTVRVLDETGQDHWGRGLPDGVSEEDAALFVWGPWEFNTGASKQVSDNRTTRPRLYSRVDGKNWDRLALRRTKPGHWMSDRAPERWRHKHPGPLRISITCRRDPYEPWFLLHEIPAGPDIP
ncbi:MAG: hypothetical protein JWR37_3631 [Mycobacterium sp.]|nr:hypothetical protein [Mycobacterium sp.]